MAKARSVGSPGVQGRAGLTPRLGHAVAARVESTVVAVISGTLHDVGARAAGSRHRFERRPGVGL